MENAMCIVTHGGFFVCPGGPHQAGKEGATSRVMAVASTSQTVKQHAPRATYPHEVRERAR
eukprot:8612101-Alexandrium_andersonii.AAC.1